MMEQNREEKIILREDWISRFFGYLGWFRYMRSRRDGKTLFENELNALLEAKETEPQEEPGISNSKSEWKRNKRHIKKNPRTVKEKQSEADNIVYIYGNFDDGKSTYIQLLEQELIANEECTCLRYSFASEERNVGAETIAEEIKNLFEEKIDYATFPFMDIIKKEFVTEDGEKLDGYELLRAAFDVLHNKNVWAMKELVGQLKLLMKPSDEVEAQSKVFYDQFNRIKTICENKIDFKNLMATNPYLFLIMDLWGFVECYPEEQFVCIIDDFEQFIYRLEKFSSEDDEEKKINSIMNMMKSMSDIVWVLISNEKASETVKQHIRQNNSWHMKGLDKKRTKEYVQLLWTPKKDENGKIDDINKVWLDKIYDKTGGYISLLNMCMRREIELEGQSSIYEWGIQCASKEIVVGALTRQDILDPKKMESRYSDYIDQWFIDLWNGDYGDDKDGESIEDIFLMREFYDAPREKTENEVNLYIPALCYLIELSKEHKNSIKQYTWNKNESFSELPFRNLKKEAKGCIQRITQECMFCLEYPQFPGNFYLDPIIIDIMQYHKLYDVWLDLFNVQGFLELNQKEISYEEKEETSSISERRVKELEEIISEKVINETLSTMNKFLMGNFQRFNEQQGMRRERFDNSHDNETLDVLIETYDASKDSKKKDTELAKSADYIARVEISDNKTVVEDNPVDQEADRIVQTENKTEGEKFVVGDLNNAKN